MIVPTIALLVVVASVGRIVFARTLSSCLAEVVPESDECHRYRYEKTDTLVKAMVGPLKSEWTLHNYSSKTRHCLNRMAIPDVRRSDGAATPYIRSCVVGSLQPT